MPLVTFIRANGKMVRLTEKVFTFQKSRALFTMVTGIWTNSMAKAWSCSNSAR